MESIKAPVSRSERLATLFPPDLLDFYWLQLRLGNWAYKLPGMD